MHFVIAERFGADPANVLDWPEPLIDDAIQILHAEGRYHARHKSGK